MDTKNAYRENLSLVMEYAELLFVLNRFLSYSPDILTKGKYPSADQVNRFNNLALLLDLPNMFALSEHVGVQRVNLLIGIANNKIKNHEQNQSDGDHCDHPYSRFFANLVQKKKEKE